jgi:hypothetical protein
MRIFDEGLMPDVDKGMVPEQQPAALAIAALVALLVLAALLNAES